MITCDKNRLVFEKAEDVLTTCVQCAEWQRRIYISLIDFSKAFDSVHRETLWKKLMAYGISESFVHIIKSNYEGFTCSVGNSDIISK